MIRFRLAELIADAQFKTGRRITIKEISESTGINRMTLSRMTNVRGYSTSTDTIDKLCQYFACDVSDVAQYIAEVAAEAKTQAPLAKKAVGRTEGARQSSARTKVSKKKR